jgi:hypothetical protein
MADDDPWTPTAVGELFMLVWANGNKQLMRVTEIRPDGWEATSASLDDAMGLKEMPREYRYYREPEDI